MGALLLDKYSFEGGTGASIRDHHLLRVVQHLWVVYAARPWILLLSQLLLHLVGLLVGHIGLPLVVDTR